MRRLLPLLLVTTLIAAACGSDSDSAADTTVTTEASPATTEAPVETTPPTTEAPVETVPESTEPTAPEVTAAELAATGPYAVGVTTRTLPEGGDVEIWYPADESTRGGTVTYNVRDFLPEAVAQFITGDIDDSYTIDATRDAPPAADGPFPVVLFSHGAAAFRLQSSELAHHLASWGIVTASTDHPSRDLLNRFGGTAEGQPPAIEQMRSMRTSLGELGDDPLLGGTLDTERVALGGHSAGGGTIAEMASDPDILGYVSYASGLGDAAPDVPSLFMAGALDGIVEPGRTEAAFATAPPPSWLWIFGDTGHLAFSDLCAIGTGDSNLIDLGEQAGLGDFLDENIRRLATDGCDEPNRPVQEVWPGIFQASTGFYRWVFGIDPEPVGLDESVVTEGVTITSK
jgi:predicted dienelactone hydrolase